MTLLLRKLCVWSADPRKNIDVIAPNAKNGRQTLRCIRAVNIAITIIDAMHTTDMTWALREKRLAQSKIASRIKEPLCVSELRT